MKFIQAIRRRFSRKAVKETVVREPASAAAKEAVDDRQEWEKKIDVINARCEEYKTRQRMAQGGRLVTLDDEPAERIH